MLRRWMDFPQQHYQQFDNFTTLFGDDRLFPPNNDITTLVKILFPSKRTNKQDFRPYIRAYLELPATHIINEFLQRTTDLNPAGLMFGFSNSALGTGRQRRLDDTSSAASSGSDQARSPRMLRVRVGVECCFFFECFLVGILHTVCHKRVPVRL